MEPVISQDFDVSCSFEKTIHPFYNPARALNSIIEVRLAMTYSSTGNGTFANEAFLLDLIYNGRPGVLPEDKKAIDAAYLLKHILEIDSPEHGRAIRWEIHNAIFAEEFDLRDGCRRGGGPLPALVFVNCEFKAGFSAQGGRMERLSFDGCRFTCADDPDKSGKNSISLRNCRIQSELNIKNLRPGAAEAADSNKEALLWIDAFAISVGTNVVIAHTLLRGPRNQSYGSLPEARYALDLSTAEIHCDLCLQPNVFLEGGLKMRDARIGGTVWAQALYATDGENEESRKRIVSVHEQPRAAFRAQGAHIRGSLVLDAIAKEDENYQKIVDSAYPAKTSLEQASPSEITAKTPSLRARDPLRFWCIGAVDLTGLELEGNFILSGAHIGGTPDSSLQLAAARLGGGLYAQAIIPRERVPKPPESQKLLLRTVGPIALDSCHISGDCLVEVECLDTKGITANGTVVAGNLRFEGKAQRLDASGLEIGRDAVLAVETLRSCNLGGSNVKGKLDISETRFADRLYWAIQRVWNSAQESGSVPWKIQRVRRHPLNFHPGLTLWELTVPIGSPPQYGSVAFVSNQGAGTFVVNGSPSQLNELSHAAPPKLEDDKSALEYLRFVCAYYVCDPLGRLVIVDRPLDLPKAFQQAVAFHPVTVTQRKAEGSARTYEVTTLARRGSDLLKVNFVLSETGKIARLNHENVIVNDRPVVYHRDEYPQYIMSFRFGSNNSPSDFLPDSYESEIMNSPKEFLRQIPSWKQLVRRAIGRDFNTMSLRDADIGHALVVSPVYSEITSVNQQKLTCYKGFMLSQIELPWSWDSRAKVASFLHSTNRVVLLTGNSKPLHDLNKEIGLHLQDEQTAVEYLRLFCAYVWGEDGAFVLIEKAHALPGAFRDTRIHPVQASKQKISIPGDVYYFDAFVKYGAFLFKATFEVRADGWVEMLDNEPEESVVYEPEERTYYSPPFRLGTLRDIPDFDSDSAMPARWVEPNTFKRDIPNWSELLMQDKLTGVEFDLRDASCSTLIDNAGKVWDDALPVKLEEFTYNTMFLPSGAEVKDELDARLRWLSGLPRQSRWQSLKYSIARAFQVLPFLRRAESQNQYHPFRSQPYIQLAQAFRQRGDDDSARTVEAKKIALAAHDRANDLSGRFFMLWWWFYGVFYKFGISPGRALATLGFVWVVGIGAIQLLDESDLLKANLNVTAQAAVIEPEEKIVPGVYAAAPGTSPPKLPCGAAISPALYAAELMIPVWNLHQESRCEIREANASDQNKSMLTFAGRKHHVPHLLVLPSTWEYLRAAYIAFASLVTSLAVLTFSGIARRWEQ